MCVGMYVRRITLPLQNNVRYREFDFGRVPLRSLDNLQLHGGVHACAIAVLKVSFDSCRW